MMDPAELTHCFDRNAAAMILYARQWLDSAGAEDVVQESFVRLMLSTRCPENVKAWLYRTTRNLAISQWRSGRRRQQREQAVARVEPLLECHEGDAADAQIAVNALESLSDIQREIIVLRIWGQLKLAEIAGVVDAPVSTVFHNYQQGLREIRKRLGIPCKNEND
ncbi:MAG TPA: RNA polymerase sigma factor [Tepidisphaeraceae bacterium]|jgi:RNA polymerase sigma-70 factor (ECF subfamily)